MAEPKLIKFPKRKVRTLEQQLADIVDKLRHRDGPVATFHLVASLAECLRKDMAKVKPNG